MLMEFPVIDYGCIGKRIRSARKRQGISQQALAETIACTPTYISYIESGVRSMSLDTFILITNALDISSDELLIDCLQHSTVAINAEFARIIADCSPSERRVLADLIRTAKHALRSNN